MGFDKHFYEDHCYMDDPTSYVGMNVEIIEDTSEASTSTPDWQLEAVSKAGRDSGSSFRVHNGLNYETMGHFEIADNDQNSHTDCDEEHSQMFLLEDEKLVKPGDKFDSHKTFIQYLNENAKRWNYYYSCSDSRKPNTENEFYVYNCVYLRNKEKYKKKGIRKRNNTMKTDCPCKIKLRRLPYEKELTVVDVCNHHDHNLSSEQFHKLQHGRRLPPYVKEEILDFLTLQTERSKIRKYVEMETGFRMSHTFFYTLEKNMQRKGNINRQITEERLQMLNEKIVAAEQMYNYKNDEQNKKHAEESAFASGNITQGTLKNKNNYRKYSKTKRQSKASPEVEVTSTSITDNAETDTCFNVTYNETSQNVTNLQKIVKCEIQKNPWVPDQCVPVLPNKTGLDDNCQESHSETQQEHQSDSLNFSIVYDPGDNAQETTKHIFNEINNYYHNTEIDNQNDAENVSYETVIIDNNEALNDDEELCNNTQEHVTIDSEMTDGGIAINNNDLPEKYVSSNNLEVHTIELMPQDNENLINYIQDTDDNTTGHDIGVQTHRNIDTGQTLMPVFDVYMKDGNVMGFVVNDHALKGLKDAADVGIQTSEDIIYSDIQELENDDLEIIEDSNDQIHGTHTHNKETYTKHEYVHRYNIEQYMTQPQFPKYVEILAKETHMDVLNMFTNIYNEKAMFKLTTTQMGNEGNTRIRYITHNGKINKKKSDDAKREKFGKNLQSIFILKEKMRILKKKNVELIQRNEYLQEVAIKLANLE